MYQGLERKKISHNANYLVCFVLYDPSLDQRILLRKEQKNILKLKIKLIGSFILTKPKGKAQIFPYITLDTEEKEHIWHSCK